MYNALFNKDDSLKKVYDSQSKKKSVLIRMHLKKRIEGMLRIELNIASHEEVNTHWVISEMIIQYNLKDRPIA